ncbi:hypothetical protein N836_35410 [Leptolyngbya sp. Heron Island J]|nr:hypothetical protein N836_35410 [Leptolyngbya sp. Heron Island J]
MTADTDITAHINGEFGAALAIVAVIIAIIFWKFRAQLLTQQFSQ